MSINSMTNSAAGRRSDLLPAQKVPSSVTEIAEAARTAPTPVSRSGNAVDAEPPAPVNTALNVLIGYIPTEIITLYVAVLAALDQTNNVTIAGAFWAFLALTPIVVWLVFAAKMKAIDKRLPWRFQCLPLWEMFAATASFTAWAFALPQSPFVIYQWYSPALSGLAVLIVSTFLALLAPLFQGELKP